ncbi:Hypothetical Protein XCAW_00798 [Xanthomonas citri subsp. citri Aw12879]|nr:Hypothetical Protein XCAW_00798 [Xanthomonas citri subsp. citri Aw12879]
MPMDPDRPFDVQTTKSPRSLEGFCSSQDTPGTEFGAPGGIRTPDQWLRKPLLYPAELRAPGRTLCQNSRHARDGAGRRRTWASHGVTGDVMTPASRPGQSVGRNPMPRFERTGPRPCNGVAVSSGSLQNASPLNVTSLTVRLSTHPSAVTAELAL